MMKKSQTTIVFHKVQNTVYTEDCFLNVPYRTAQTIPLSDEEIFRMFF